LDDQRWIWEKVEPHWQKTFAWLSKRHGFSTRINEDVFNLTYDFAARYDRHDQQEYEAAFYKTFVQMIDEGMQIVDIGAHIGIFTLGAAKRIGREQKVYAFEPSPETAQILKRHIRLNGLQDRVEIVRAVVCDFDGAVPFYVYGSSMAASLARENVESLNPEHPNAAVKIETAAVTLDEYCRVRNIKPDLLKVDVEGAELLVLHGAKNLLLNENISILCEIHPNQMKRCKSSLPDLLQYLDSIGYCLKPLDESTKLGTFHTLITRRK
jgi:FkbM family methyltransferase